MKVSHNSQLTPNKTIIGKKKSFVTIATNSFSLHNASQEVKGLKSFETVKLNKRNPQTPIRNSHQLRSQ
jgi:hypothetical protein